MSEFVEFDADGKETTRIDQVLSASEHPGYWEVDNGYHVYRVDKKPGHTYTIRVMGVS